VAPVGYRLLGAVAAPIRRFFNLEAASAIVLLAAALLALAWANSPLGWAYRLVFEQPVLVRAGAHGLRVTLWDAMTDGLMPFFFFLSGMEIKRELVEGERCSRRQCSPVACSRSDGSVFSAGPCTPALASCSGSRSRVRAFTRRWRA